MSTVIMGIPPEDTQALKTDPAYLERVESAMSEALGRKGVDEVVLVFRDEPEGPANVARNPSIQNEFVKHALWVALSDYRREGFYEGTLEDLTSSGLSDAEISLILDELAKLCRAAIEHTHRYRKPVKDPVKEFAQDFYIGLLIESKDVDQKTGAIFNTKERLTQRVDASGFAHDVGVILGSDYPDEKSRRRLTTILKESLDRMIDVLVEFDKIERKRHKAWREAVIERIRKTTDLVNRAIENKRLIETGWIPKDKTLLEHKKWFTEVKKLKSFVPYPASEYGDWRSYLLSVLRKDIDSYNDDITRDTKDLEYMPLFVAGDIVDVCPFSPDSFSDCARKMIRNQENRMIYPHGRLDPRNADDYLFIQLFERTTGCKLFAD